MEASDTVRLRCLSGRGEWCACTIAPFLSLPRASFFAASVIAHHSDKSVQI